MRLLRYIKGYRKGKEAHLLEKEAMRDPFLADALEGFDEVGGRHPARIERLRKEVKRKSARKTHYLRVCAVAAGIVFLIGVGGYFLMWQVGRPPEMRIEYEDLESRTLPPPPPSVPVAAESREAIAQNRQQETNVESVIAFIEDSDNTSVPPPPLVPLPVIADVVVESDASAKDIQAIPPPKEARAAMADRIRVRGKIVDQGGEPIIGASVQADSSKSGTITNIDGYFELQAGNNEKIRVNYVGYEAVSLPADTGKNMLIAMHENSSALDEVVVTGYGSHKQDALKTPKEPVPVMGKKAFNNYLKENLRRPDDDDCRDVKGKVTLQFYVNPEGRPYNITVSKGLCETADREAVRLISEGPEWVSGEKEVTVDVKF